MAWAVCLALLAPVPALAETEDPAKIRWSGDARLRLESDVDSHRADGSERSDRDRLRLRARVAVDYRPTEALRFGLRLRTGSRDSHQSPHVTLEDFDGNPVGDSDLNVDKLFVQAKRDTEEGSLWGWAGRQSLPFWKQNELVWDDDVTPAGLAGGWTWNDAGDSGGKTTVQLGFLTPPVGMRDFAGRLASAQWMRRSGPWTVALGLLALDADPDSTDAVRLLRGNGLRDYQLWIAAFQYRASALGRSVTLGLDLIHNGESYGGASSDPLAADFGDEKDGWVVSSRWGGGNRSGDDWSVAWTYAHIEALAVDASYAQDDWMRWGSATETRSSDFSGHELRLTVALGRLGQLVTRYYDVESLSSVEDGRRLRLDWNIRF